MSLPSSPARQNSPQRKSPNRRPLQERTQSQANEISSRLGRDANDDWGNQSALGTTPFPTKASQILLPSTIRKQKSVQNLEPLYSSSSSSTPRLASRIAPRNARQPAVRLKRSVKALRDLYEAQAEEPRPSTASSLPQRPSTANSRLRRASSSEGLAGKYAWENFAKVSSDDLAILPSLPEGVKSLRQIEPRSSFARQPISPITSSPNYRVHPITSSPSFAIYRDSSSPIVEVFDQTSTNPSTDPQSSSSPNVVRLAPSSSIDDLPGVEYESSSPNFIKLGTSSPTRTLGQIEPSSPIHRRRSSLSSTSSKKRKRSVNDDQVFQARIVPSNPFSSSPPYQRPHTRNISTTSDAILASSPPLNTVDRSPFEDSSSIVHAINSDDLSSDEIADKSSVSDAHAHLQSVLSSSPAPPIQYPVVRAPAPSQFASIVIPKRKYRLSPIGSVSTRKSSRISPRPSEESENNYKMTYKRSSAVENLSESPDEDPPTPIHPFFNQTVNNSITRMLNDHDQHEADDEVAALPRGEYAYLSPQLKPVRSISYSSLANSSQSRVNSARTSIDNRLDRMRSFTHSRQNSFRSFRPGSSGSTTSTVAVPGWARRYYSGCYDDSFKTLYGSKMKHQSATAVLAQTPTVGATTRPGTAKSRNSRPSFVSIRNSISERIPAIFRPRNRPRMAARKSHLVPGVGPLVSNPVDESEVIMHQSQRQSYTDPRMTIRPVSVTLSPVDPRAHWAGLTEEVEVQILDPRASGALQDHRQSSESSNLSVIRYPRSSLVGRIRAASPHLHHDHRLNTGSTASRGYGYPYNRKARYDAPSLMEEPRHNFRTNKRVLLIACFISGFIVPIMWFIGALLPLPQRPDSFKDLEKAHWNRYSADLSDWDNMDILAKLRAEKQLRGAEEVEWQNIRWWKTLNRWMSIVGGLVLITVIVLSIIGSKARW